MPSLQFSIDRLSFWLGFIAATLLWWLFYRVRPLFPEWRDQIRQYIDTISARNLAGVEEYLRRETLRRAQHQHLAAQLFSLDEILIQPRLLVPPSGKDPTNEPQQMSMAGQYLPYLPDWPELTAPLGAPTLTLLQALQSERHLAIIGQPGSGRTVALAHLASQIARRDPTSGKYAAAVPIFVHAIELDPTLAEDRDPLLNLIKVISGNASAIMQPQIPRFLKTVFRDKQRRVVLLLDGLDELVPAQMDALLEYLAAFLKKHPRLQIVTTASVDYQDGLMKMQFYPLAVAAWGQAQRVAFAQQWGQLWTAQLLPEIKHQDPAAAVDPLLVQNWLVGETAYASPLEWTLRLWGAYAGDLSGSEPLTILETHLTRFLPGPACIPAVQELAHRMVQKPGASLRFDEAEDILSHANVALPADLPFELETSDTLLDAAIAAARGDAAPDSTADDPEAPAEPEKTQKPEPAAPAGKSRKQERKPVAKSTASQGEQIINALIHGGILVRYANHQVRFASPVFLALLAGARMTAEEATAMAATIAQAPANPGDKKLSWPIFPLVLQYTAACSEAPEWIYTLIENPVSPLFHNLLLVARWLRDAPANAEWRPHLMRILVNLLQNEMLPFGSRARVAAAFYLSRDPSTAKLFKQLLGAKSPALRRAALLGCGALSSPQLINDILGMLADSSSQIRYTACMALAAIPAEPALNALVEVLLSGDEEIRQAAAEALAQIQPDGHKVLEEATTVDDLLTRRAAVFGLLQVGGPWAQKVLEKVAVEDGQWIVRNAASQALEILQQNAPLVPKILPQPSDSPWLITFASKLGTGLLPGQPATDVLLKVLKSGSPEEQTAALNYLRDQADEGVIRAIYELLYSGQEELQEPILHALWWIAGTGVNLPSPEQFGLG